jgi:hypothetical protein
MFFHAPLAMRKIAWIVIVECTPPAQGLRSRLDSHIHLRSARLFVHKSPRVHSAIALCGTNHVSVISDSLRVPIHRLTHVPADGGLRVGRHALPVNYELVALVVACVGMCYGATFFSCVLFGRAKLSVYAPMTQPHHLPAPQPPHSRLNRRIPHLPISKSLHTLACLAPLR